MNTRIDDDRLSIMDMHGQGPARCKAIMVLLRGKGMHEQLRKLKEMIKANVVAGTRERLSNQKNGEDLATVSKLVEMVDVMANQVGGKIVFTLWCDANVERLIRRTTRDWVGYDVNNPDIAVEHQRFQTNDNNLDHKIGVQPQDPAMDVQRMEDDDGKDVIAKLENTVDRTFKDHATPTAKVEAGQQRQEEVVSEDNGVLEH